MCQTRAEDIHECEKFQGCIIFFFVSFVFVVFFLYMQIGVKLWFNQYQRKVVDLLSKIHVYRVVHQELPTSIVQFNFQAFWTENQPVVFSKFNQLNRHHRVAQPKVTIHHKIKISPFNWEILLYYLRYPLSTRKRSKFTTGWFIRLHHLIKNSIQSTILIQLQKQM